MTGREARWWETATAPARGRNGDIVLPAGRSTPIPCPVCWAEPIVYNGNYFCDGFGLDDQSCTWALAHPARSKRDRRVCDLIGIDYH